MKHLTKRISCSYESRALFYVEGTGGPPFRGSFTLYPTRLLVYTFKIQHIYICANIEKLGGLFPGKQFALRKIYTARLHSMRSFAIRPTTLFSPTLGAPRKGNTGCASHIMVCIEAHSLYVSLCCYSENHSFTDLPRYRGRFPCFPVSAERAGRQRATLRFAWILPHSRTSTLVSG